MYIAAIHVIFTRSTRSMMSRQMRSTDRTNAANKKRCSPASHRSNSKEKRVVKHVEQFFVP